MPLRVVRPDLVTQTASLFPCSTMPGPGWTAVLDDSEHSVIYY